MLHFNLERCASAGQPSWQDSVRHSRNEPGKRVGRGLGTRACVVAGSFLSCWSVGMG
jgi:hypothetical protein